MTVRKIPNWRGRGYFEFPLSQETLEDLDARQEWSVFGTHLARCKSGDFAKEGELWAAIESSNDWLVIRAYCFLLGRTASHGFLRELAPLTVEYEPFFVAHRAANVLAVAGLLEFVPDLVSHVRAFFDVGDHEQAFWALGRMLDAGSGDLMQHDVLDSLDRPQVLNRWANDVGDRAAEIETEYRSRSIVVANGDRFSMDRLLSSIEDGVETNSLTSELREAFEAFTGVDCSGFWTADESLNPTGAFATLLEFRESGSLSNFEPGKRYFFGHPVPE